MSAARGAIFDLDGVLVDSAEPHRRSWERLAEELGLDPPGDFFRRNFGRVNAEILPEFSGRELSAEEIGSLSSRKDLLYREAAATLELFPGARDLLRGLRAAGWRLALGSSTSRSNLEFLLPRLGLDRLLDAWTCSDDVSRGKPDPEVFLKAAGKIGVPPSACVVVEDAPAGVAAARAAGMRCLAVATTRTREELEREGPDLVVGSLAELSPADFERLPA